MIALSGRLRCEASKPADEAQYKIISTNLQTKVVLLTWWFRYAPQRTFGATQPPGFYPFVNEKYNACRVKSVIRNGCAGR
jgi:hypothetical protein